MPTAQFQKSCAEARKRNYALTFEEKKRIWKHCKRDWNNGEAKRTWYKPFPAAEEIHKSLARFLIIAAGNRFAKSLIAGMEALAAMTVPGTCVWIVGSQYSVCNHEWRYIEHGLLKTDVWEKVIKKRMKKELDKLKVDYSKWDDSRFRNYVRINRGSPKSLEIDWPISPVSRIEQKSYGTDWAQLEGEKVSMMIFAEGSRVPVELWDRHLRMRLSDMYGRIIIPATPKGRDSFLYPAYQKGLSRELIVDIDRQKKRVTHKYKDVDIHKDHVSRATSYSESYETFNYPAFENPYYNTDEYKAQITSLFEGQTNESIFRERIFGTFESLSGNFFAGVEEDIMFVNSFPLPSNVTYYRTMDPGRAGKACCLWVAVQPWDNGKYRYIIFKELYQEGMYVESFADAVKRMTTERIYYTVSDRQVNQSRFDSKDNVFKRLVDLGIKPLKTPTPGMLPHTTVERFNFWLPDAKDGRIIVFKDKCQNFQREFMECEYAPPRLNAGRAVREERLLKTDQNALDAFTYLRYFNPRHHTHEEILEQKNKEEIFKKKAAPHPMSIGAVIQDIERDNRLGILSALME